MTAKAALCLALLQGKVLSIKNGFDLFGITNLPREIGRSIEREKDGGFGVEVSRVEKTGVSRYGQTVRWYEYRLNKTDYNKEGIEKMKAYVKEQMSTVPPKTEKEKKEFKQTELFAFNKNINGTK